VHQRVSLEVIGSFAFNCLMKIITFWMCNLETISFALENALENGGIFKTSLIESCTTNTKTLLVASSSSSRLSPKWRVQKNTQMLTFD
jgi:hypothetical protein